MDRDEVFSDAKNPFILQQRAEEMLEYTHDALGLFPKKERFTLCATIEKSALKILCLSVRVKKRYYKKNTLQDIDVEVDTMRSLIKISDSFKYISHGKMKEWLDGVNELGKITGGLKKTFDK